MPLFRGQRGLPSEPLACLKLGNPVPTLTIPEPIQQSPLTRPKEKFIEIRSNVVSRACPSAGSRTN